MAIYAMIDNASGYVWGDTAELAEWTGSSPEDAVRALDLALGELDRDYELGHHCDEATEMSDNEEKRKQALADLRQAIELARTTRRACQSAHTIDREEIGKALDLIVKTLEGPAEWFEGRGIKIHPPCSKPKT